MKSISVERTRQRGHLRLLLTSPVIYAMIIPLVFIDLCATLYQTICFPAYGIPRVPRKKYVQLVKRGHGLWWFDQFNCTYCSYANGVAAYVRAVLIETEKYWCPIKYKMRVGYQPPHPQGTFAPDGDTDALEKVLWEKPRPPQGTA
jgi:hypothetical protein